MSCANDGACHSAALLSTFRFKAARKLALLYVEQHWPLAIAVAIIRGHFARCVRACISINIYSLEPSAASPLAMFPPSRRLVCVFVFFPGVHTHNSITFKNNTVCTAVSVQRVFFFFLPLGAFPCVLIMAPSGLRLPLMQWRPTGVKQVQSGTWAPPINPFHCVKPNIIAWGAGGHGLPSVGWNGH